METDVIAKILEWFRRAVPDPTDKNRAVQVGCHFEEVGEMVDTLQNPWPDSHDAATIHDYARFFKQNCEGIRLDSGTTLDRVALLDALCDQIVTAVGVAHMFGLDIETGLHRVNGSNWSKFVDGGPVFDANGKITKGPDYYKPDLQDLVG